MSAAANYLENEILDHVLGKGTRDFTSPTNLYVGLFRNDSGNAATNLEAGTLTDEVSGGSYARASVSFNAASGGAAVNSAVITFPAATDTWGSITHVAILDASTGGNVLFWGQATNAKTITSGDTYQISQSNMSVTVA